MLRAKTKKEPKKKEEKGSAKKQEQSTTEETKSHLHSPALRTLPRRGPSRPGPEKSQSRTKAPSRQRKGRKEQLDKCKILTVLHRSAILIQKHVRAFLARKLAHKLRHRIPLRTQTLSPKSQRLKSQSFLEDQEWFRLSSQEEECSSQVSELTPRCKEQQPPAEMAELLSSLSDQLLELSKNMAVSPSWQIMEEILSYFARTRGRRVSFKQYSEGCVLKSEYDLGFRRCLFDLVVEKLEESASLEEVVRGVDECLGPCPPDSSRAWVEGQFGHEEEHRMLVTESLADQIMTILLSQLLR